MENEEQTIAKEKQQAGKVTSAVYMAYLKAVNNKSFVFFVAILFIITQAIHSSVDFFVSIW